MLTREDENTLWIGIDKEELSKLSGNSSVQFSPPPPRFRISIPFGNSIYFLSLLRKESSLVVVVENSECSARAREANCGKVLRRRKSALLRNGRVRIEQKQQKPLNISPTNRRLLDLWRSLGLRRQTNERTQKQAVDALNAARRGKMFNGVAALSDYHGVKFEEGMIAEAIKNFALAATSPDYLPIGKKALRKKSMKSFFYDSWIQDEDKSAFIKYLECKPKLVSEKVRTVKDHHPEITEQLMSFYAKTVLGRKRPDFSTAERNQFIRGAAAVVEFYDEHKGAMASWVREAGPLKVADALCHAFEEDVERGHKGDWSRVSIGWLCSGYAIERKLPAYMKKQSMFEDAKSFSIYD